MSLITISETDIAEYHGGATPAYARLYADQEFISSEGVIIASGASFYQHRASFTQDVWLRLF